MIFMMANRDKLAISISPGNKLSHTLTNLKSTASETSQFNINKMQKPAGFLALVS